MMGNNISKVVTAINASGGGITEDGEYLILNGQSSKTGKINVRCSGSFGGADVRVGYLEKGDFAVQDLPSGDPAVFTGPFALRFDCGTYNNISSGPAIQVASISGTTDAILTISSID